MGVMGCNIWTISSQNLKALFCDRLSKIPKCSNLSLQLYPDEDDTTNTETHLQQTMEDFFSSFFLKYQGKPGGGRGARGVRRDGGEWIIKHVQTEVQKADQDYRLKEEIINMD